MSSYAPIGSEIIPQGIAETSTAQKLDLGTVVKANDRASTQYGQGEFIYASGCASTVIGSLVLINPDDWSTSLAVAADKGILAVAMSANPASSFGFYQIYGKGVVKALTGFLDNANCYLTATPGSIDDAVVSGDFIYGMKGASAVGTPSTGLAEVELNYPSVKASADANLADLGVTATAAELNKNSLSGQAETLIAAGAISVTKKNSKLALVGAGAVTLAAPDATMYGLVKTIEMTADNGDVTLALTNVQGQSSGTTATFNDVGDALILVGGTSKWHVIGESGISLS